MPRAYSQDLRGRAIWLTEIMDFQIDEVRSLASSKSQKYSIQYFSNYICPKIKTKLLCTIDKLDTSGASGTSFFCTAKTW